MKKMVLIAVVSLAMLGCGKSPTYGVGKTIELAQDKVITLDAVTRLVHSIDFKQAFVKNLPDKRVAKNIKSSDVTFKVWASNDGSVMLDYHMPGYLDSDLDAIAEYLKDLITTRLAAQQDAAADADKPRR